MNKHASGLINTLPEKFCVAPFVQCTTHPSRSFSPCPYLGGTVWADQSGTILERWNSTGLENLRQDFINNRQNAICNRCWHEESNGKQSLRLRLFDPVKKTTNYSFIDPSTFGQHVIDLINFGSYQQGPKVLTIKNGNVCNAKCRVCHPNDSSRWVDDAEKIYQITGQAHYNLNQQEKNWTDDQIEEILALAPNLTRLELFGGEPTYNKQVKKLLEQLVKTGHSNHIILYINTNGGVDIVDRWPFIYQFAQIEIGVSLDGVGKHFDYIRHGLDYNGVVKNIVKLQDYLTSKNAHYFIDSISTVEILNVYYLPELKRAVKDILPLPPFWNLLINPDYLFIKNMPDHVKQAVIDKLSNDSEFNDLINVINQPADLEQWEIFLELTAVLDNIRNESFQLTFPEFYNIIHKS